MGGVSSGKTGNGGQQKDGVYNGKTGGMVGNRKMGVGVQQKDREGQWKEWG